MTDQQLPTPADDKSKRKGRTAVKLGISLVLLTAVLWFLDLRELGALLLKINPWYLLAAVVVLYADRALMAYKWGLLLKAADTRVPFFLLFRTYAISPLPGVLLPSNLGGDLFRLYSVARHDNSKTGAVLASLVVERVIAVVALLIVVSLSMGLALYLIEGSGKYVRSISGILLLGGGLTTIVLAMFRRLAAKKINELTRRLRECTLGRKLHKIYLMCRDYQKHGRAVTLVFAWTLIEQFVPIIGFLLRGYALHINVSILQLAAIVPLVVLVVRLPITFNGYGIEEGMYVALLSLIGVSASEAFLLSLSGRVLLLLTAVPWGLHFILSGNTAASKLQEKAMPAKSWI